MHDSEFWSFVHGSSVPLLNPDRGACRAALCRKLDPDQAEAVWWLFRLKAMELDHAVEAGEILGEPPFPLERDARVNLLAYVAALGKADFEAAKTYPAILWRRATQLDFLEDFLEGIPSSSDYALHYNKAPPK